MRNRLQVNALGALCALATIMVLGAAPESAVFSAPGAVTLSADSPVADAAQRGDTEKVRALLRDGADVNAAQGDGMTALHWAAMNGDVATMEVLLYAGANLEPVTRLGAYTPLHLASREGEGEAVAMLLEAGSDAGAVTSTGVQALHFAAAAGDPGAVRALIEHGADVNVRDDHSRTPLHYAAASNRVDALAALLEAGGDVWVATKVTDTTALAQEDDEERQMRQRVIDARKPPEPGAQSERDRLAALLAQRGRGGQPPAANPGRGGAPGRRGQPGQEPPDPDTPRRQPADPSNPAASRERRARPAASANRFQNLSYDEQVGRQGGFTPLHYAARDGHADAALLLLEAGADVDYSTRGDDTSPLLMAVINGNYDLAMEFLQRGADPNATSDDGVGPLFAVLNNEWALRTWYPQPTAGQQQETSYLDLMRALLEAGADPNARTSTHVWYAAYNAGRMGVDFTGATPFWRAAYALDVTAMRMLVEYGADPNIPTANLAGGRRRSFFGRRPNEPEDEDEKDPSGLPPVPPGGPAVHPLHAASGVGFGTSRVGQQHRHVPDGWLPAVRYLVEELGVDVDVRDHAGYTALHNAAARGDNETIMFLVEHGADVSVVSRRGQTPVDMANGPQQRVQPFYDTIALLEGLGAINNHRCISC